MRAARRDPRRGAIPVELVSSQPPGDFPLPAIKLVISDGRQESRGVGDKIGL